MIILSVLSGTLGLMCFWAFKECITEERTNPNVHYTDKEFAIIFGVFLLLVSGAFLYMALTF